MMGVVSLRQRIALELQRQLTLNCAREHPLREIFWECTLRCCLECRHCGSDCKVTSGLKDMPFADFEMVLRRINEAYGPEDKMVILSGGEPLMRRDLEDCIRRIREMGFSCGMVTNGYLLTRERAAGLLRAGLGSATVSIDGTEADHDWMRGVSGSFTRALNAAMILSGSGIVFDVVTCVNRRNLAHLEELKEILISSGIKAWRLFTIFPAGRAAEDPQLQLTSQEFRRLMDFIVRTRNEGRIRTSYACEGFLGEYEGKVRDNLYMCQAGLTVASVLADGSISACASIRSDYHQGNIYKDDFVDVWENRYRPYRDRRWMKKDDCATCKWFRYCQGNGMHLRDSQGNLLLCNLKKL